MTRPRLNELFEALAGALVAAFVVRPLYLFVARALVPGFDAFYRLKHAQSTYQSVLVMWTRLCRDLHRRVHIRGARGS